MLDRRGSPSVDAFAAMNTVSQTHPRRTRSVPVQLAAIIAGILGAWSWIALSPRLLQAMPVKSELHGVVLFYCLLFLPLIVLAFVLGLICNLRVLRSGQHPLFWLLAGLAAGAAALCIAVLYSWINGGVVPGSAAERAGHLILLGLVLTLIQASAEEFLVRGWLQPVLIGFAGPALGILLASLLFAGLHLASGPVVWHALANMVIAGILFGTLAWRSGGIIAPIAAHFGWNAAEDVGFGLVPNPGIGAFGALRDLDLAGSPLWGGSEHGLNASMGTTIVIVALVLPLLAMTGQRSVALPQEEA
jgi:hypothetical protein